MKTERFSFGTLSDGTEVSALRIENGAGASLTVLDYGATIQSLHIPNWDGGLTDVVLGYDSASEYEKNDAYLGATIGRVGNRIGGAVFSLGGRNYALAKNDGANHLHGGVRGFDKRMWNLREEDGAAVFSRVSPAGEEGYPGNLSVTVRVFLTEDNALHLAYAAETDADTPVNLTNHSYFNLDGGGTILDHELTVYAERFCEGDAGCLPTGRLLEAAGTPFDFREGKPIGRDIGASHEQLRRAGGYDHNYCLSGRRAALLRGARSGIVMTVDTDLPGMQVYSGNFLTRRTGKGGGEIDYRCGLCLETQLFPDGMAHWGFPSPVLRAGERMRSETVYTFSLA
ncbi:MAG: galactose mutarotase [Oscillospiraceae bacterium]|nr:galactose mutarotase [Oscillospiraceae bacterium]